MEEVYCRFCAERKRPEKLLNLLLDPATLEDTMKKLESLNLTLSDVSEASTLPKTVCLLCLDSLNNASEFSNMFRNAQSILQRICLDRSFDVKCDDSDVDTAEPFDVIFPPEAKCNEPLKTEKQLAENTDTSSTKPSTFIKVEPDNLDEQNAEPDVSLNVQALLDAAICNLPIAPNVTLYAKEVPGVSKRKIKSWKNYPCVCVHCSIECPGLEALRSHKKTKHDLCGGFACTDCKDYQIYNDFDMFINHVRKHRKGLRNICPYCDMKSDNISKHEKEHLTKPNVACTCGEILPNEEALHAHDILYKNKRKKSNRRKRGAPITTEDLTCEFCQKIYKNLNSLRDHKKLHTQERKKNYTCDRCGKTFYNKGTLTSHVMSHDKIKPYPCKICHKSFLFPNMLRRHIEMHSGVKPFSCEQCGRCFRLQYQLNTHKIIHTDSMPYVCQYCSKAFRFKQILKNHERQHTGAKPYGCIECSMEFTNWSNYNKHMKRRHGTDTSKKKITPEGTFSVDPATGKIMDIEDRVGYEEWKSKVMVPGKRGRKKVIKKEVNS